MKSSYLFLHFTCVLLIWSSIIRYPCHISCNYKNLTQSVSYTDFVIRNSGDCSNGYCSPRIGFRMITCERKVVLKLGVVCMCILWISIWSSIMTIFRQFLPELWPFLYFQFAKYLVSERKFGLKLGVVCMCILWICIWSSIMTIFRQFLPELCPFFVLPVC